MKRADYLKALKQAGVIETLEEGKELLKKIDLAIEVAVETEGSTKVCEYFTVEKEHKESKTGEMTRIVDGEKVKVPYTSEAKDVLKFKGTALAKNYTK